MMKLADTERKYIIRRSAAAISQLQEGEEAVSVLSGIYCGTLPDKSPRQGELMAQEVLEWIGRFQEACDGAMEAPEDYLCKAVAAPLAQLPLEEQCEFLGRQLEVRIPQPPTEAERDSLLREAARQMLAGEGFPKVQPGTGESSGWENVPRRNEAKGIVGEEMFLAVTAMVVYTMAINGELSGVPDKISLAQVTVGVCAEDKLAELQWAAEMGYLEKTLIENRLKILKTACISTMLAALAVVGLGGWLVGMPLAAVAALCGYTVLWLGTILAVYYKVNAEMIREEAASIPCRTVAANPVEVTEAEGENTAQKHLPWPEPAQQKPVEKAENPVKARTKQ